jgi:hypothetical protein
VDLATVAVVGTGLLAGGKLVRDRMRSGRGDGDTAA